MTKTSQRHIRPELLDETEPEIARRSLADLVRLNGHFDGHGVLRGLLAQVVRRDEVFSLLDVGEWAPEPKLRGDTFDFVLCSLFFHHFQDDQIVALLRGFGVLARRAVLIGDRERHLLSYWFLPATRCIYGWHNITIHDKTSVCAAFTEKELRNLAVRAGLRLTCVKTHRLADRAKRARLKNFH